MTFLAHRKHSWVKAFFSSAAYCDHQWPLLCFALFQLIPNSWPLPQIIIRLLCLNSIQEICTEIGPQASPPTPNTPSGTEAKRIDIHVFFLWGIYYPYLKLCQKYSAQNVLRILGFQTNSLPQPKAHLPSSIFVFGLCRLRCTRECGCLKLGDIKRKVKSPSATKIDVIDYWTQGKETTLLRLRWTGRRKGNQKWQRSLLGWDKADSTGQSLWGKFESQQSPLPPVCFSHFVKLSSNVFTCTLKQCFRSTDGKCECISWYWWSFHFYLFFLSYILLTDFRTNQMLL